MFLCMVLIHTYDKNLLFTKYHGKQWGYEDTVIKNQTLPFKKLYSSEEDRVEYNKYYKG